MKEETSKKNDDFLDTYIGKDFFLYTFFEKLGRFIFIGGNKEKVRRAFYKAGYKDIQYFQSGILVFLLHCLVLFLVIMFAKYLTAFYKSWIIVGALTIFGLFIIEFVSISVFVFFVIFYLDIRKWKRAQAIEEKLPAFLWEFSTNLKAGREFLDAMDDARSDELGLLEEDIEGIVSAIRCGQIVEKVLYDYAQKYDSYIINETFEIILESYRSGGALSDIIERIAENLEIMSYMKRDAIASVMNYIIFITFIALFITPLLFALSYNLLHLIDSLIKKLVLTASSDALPSVLRNINIDFEDFKLFSYMGVGLISGCAATIIGIIRRGTLKGAASIVPIYLVISIGFYQIIFIILTYLFDKIFII